MLRLQLMHRTCNSAARDTIQAQTKHAKRPPWTWKITLGCRATGYGNSGPNNCAAASVVLVVQTIFGLLLDAITIGVLFARISHPQQRARSIFMSETAVISRRDGILKMMFRVADIKVTQARSRISSVACLYTTRQDGSVELCTQAFHNHPLDS